ncbi:MAG: four helix bundle protein [Acidobacteria bacterium]|nr:four helix bundle protein [Acidobacteriota bacterium]
MGEDHISAQSFQDLRVWQKAHQLVLEVYKVTRLFPADERFGLVSQMRRAAVSIAANIAEGFAKRGIRDKLNFFNISQGSLDELKYYLILSKDLTYLPSKEPLWSKAEEVGRMLNSWGEPLRSKLSAASRK